MSLTNSPFWFSSGASAGGGAFYPYSINQSLRFNDGDSSNLNRTPSTAGDRQVWTWSAWLKRSTLSTTQYLFVGGSDADNATYVRFFSNDKFQIFHYDSNSTTNNVQTEQVFRDVSSWYHIVLAVDTTQATASDRVKIYVNGEIVTNFTTATYPSLNFNYDINTTGSHRIGSNYNGSGTFFDGYMAEVHFADGTQYDASTFGETINGIWVPKEVSGLTYGTNGFYFDFSDNSTASALGTDSSGNSNDFSVNNLATTDQVPDSPTNNFATWSPLATNGGTLSDGNLTYVHGNNVVTASFPSPSSGKWYWENYTTSTNNGLFITSVVRDTNFYLNNSFSDGVGYYADNGNSYIDGTTAAYGATYGTGDIIGTALNVDDGEVTFYKNGVSQGTLTLPSYDGGWFAYNQAASGTLSRTSVQNFGQDSTFAGATTAGGNADANGIGDFKYSVPSGYKALCSANLPEPTIGPNSTTQSDDYFNTVLYTGNGTAIGSGGNAITGVGFQPDWVWIKERSGAASHGLYDVVRGVTEQLESDTTAAETTESEGLATFGTDGFTVGSLAQVNTNTDTYVGWNWKAGGDADTFNIDGTGYSTASAAGLDGGDITPTGASVNTTAGISIITYTGTGATSATPLTINHGLGKTPSMIILKDRDVNSNNSQWIVGHTGLATNGYIYLSLTNAAATSTSGTVAVSNADATNFALGVAASPASNTVNESGDRYVAYLFADVEGHLKCGSYVGNGNADGTFVYTGFRPAFVLLKKSSAAGDNWSMYDNKRDTDNTVREYLIPNDSQAAGATDTMDFVSNGFKVRNSGAYINTSGATYIYLAFAEQPFKYANAR